jgi:dimethylaniline monooxygenase (N-oxide forming)
VTTVQLKLVGQNLLPTKPFETIARATISLATPGFVDAVADKKITVERGSEITSMAAGWVLLSSDKSHKTLPANVIICGTGWSQSMPSFLPEHLTSTLLDENDDWVLYRHTLPIGVPRLAFAGFNSSLFCPLTAEISALWLAAHLDSTAEAPLLTLPPSDEQKRLAHEETAWMRQRTGGHHARATNIVPFSMSNIDEMLNDLHVSIGTWNWLREWILPVNPSACKSQLSDENLPAHSLPGRSRSTPYCKEPSRFAPSTAQEGPNVK